MAADLTGKNVSLAWYPDASTMEMKCATMQSLHRMMLSALYGHNAAFAARKLCRACPRCSTIPYELRRISD